LAEVYRGAATDANVDRLVSGIATTVGTDLRIARPAGQLRARARTGSPIDAIVVATAVRLAGGVIATSDPDDLSALAADHPNVRIWSLNEPT
jgi:predicted nucleic acid-binding protein